ncbi:cytochrome P450 [Aspergillus sclerotioniger CBS 115572]|uniref:Cytochrome P450 n=1 Tax=Aspergillus sclerotioniger CBS 115572 TaxID=1450535 RepID=A0A317VR56_9EURO|nr:cytochrome P450 [Aspergillus sclerotioniger CBS 115572]PWY76039.1 cytochrome P450 [Aspergillus sclerotioniger CBS 115572]
MFDMVSHALPLGLYVLVLLCLVRCSILLNKRPFPANAPKFISGYPVVGALRLFFDRGRFCQSSKTASPTGNYSYYLGRQRVVGLSGPQGRKTFFECRDLDLEQGVDLFVPFTSAVEAANDPSIETHISYFRTTVRTALLRTQSLEFIPAAIDACTTSTLNRIKIKGLIDPFQDLSWLYAQSTMAVLGVDEVARSPELSRKLSELVSAIDGTFSAIDMVIPWLLNPFHIPVMIAMGRLYVMMWKIIRNQQQQQPHKRDLYNESMLPSLIEKGRSTRAILKGNSPTVASWLLVGLATNASWMARIRQEVNQVVAKHRKDGESAEQVLRTLNAHAWENEFPLIDACHLESIRLTAGLLLCRKNISPTDVPIGDTGEVIPPGAYVTYHAEEANMDPNIYPYPQRWDPGRFLSDRAEHLKEPLAYAGFGAGRQKCLGENSNVHASGEIRHHV